MDPYNVNLSKSTTSLNVISYSGKMTEAKKDDKPINETIYIPKQQAHQLGGVSSRTQGVITLKIGPIRIQVVSVGMKTLSENFEVRKHYKGSVTTKENRGQRLTRKVSGIRKSVTNKLHQKMDIYESVFEEGRRRSIKRKDKG